MPILGNPRQSPSRRDRTRPVTRRLQPVRLGQTYMECPSDTASWLHCVDHDAPPFDPAALAAASGEDWADRWTLTRSDSASGDVTTAVSRTTTSMFDAADSVRRMTNRYGQRNRTGIAYIASTDRHHVFESLTEQAVLKQIDFAAPVDVVSQPFALRWHDGDRARRHTPDFLVREHHGTTVVNVRPDGMVKPEDDEQFAALSAVAARLGWRHVLVVGLRRPHAVVVDVLATARKEPHDPFGLCAEMHAALSASSQPFGQLVAGTRAPALARAVLLGMLWRGQAAVDLAERITDRSTVRLGKARR